MFLSTGMAGEASDVEIARRETTMLEKNTIMN
jgi:hypothetical protein